MHLLKSNNSYISAKIVKLKYREDVVRCIEEGLDLKFGEEPGDYWDYSSDEEGNVISDEEGNAEDNEG